jgi:hypothetical protein
MIGPLLMVAPVCQPGARRRLVELPPGTWYDFRTGAPVDPGPLIADVPLGSIPVFVRGGSILTLSNVCQSTTEPLTELSLEVYPDTADTGCWTPIEDDGETFSCREGMIAETDFAIAGLPQGAVLTVGGRRGATCPRRGLSSRASTCPRPRFACCSTAARPTPGPGMPDGALWSRVLLTTVASMRSSRCRSEDAGECRSIPQGRWNAVGGRSAAKIRPSGVGYEGPATLVPRTLD